MRLGPLRETCVQPAPKSRLAVSGPLVFEDQHHVGPALAGKRPVQTLTFDRSHALRGNAAPDALRPCGTGFSREEACPDADI